MESVDSFAHAFPPPKEILTTENLKASGKKKKRKEMLNQFILSNKRVEEPKLEGS